MKLCILKGSPRINGNTNSLLKPFLEELQMKGHEMQVFDLYRMKLESCVACRCCQKDWSIFGCPIKDEMGTLFQTILDCDLMVVATPIYSWFCTGPMKNVLDRMVYGMNKFYGEEKGPALWEGKSMAMVMTCGYKAEKGADLFEEAMLRYCKHSKLNYLGSICERHLGYSREFMDEEKEKNAREFAKKIMEDDRLTR